MSANAIDQGATGAAGGVLTGTYPNPGLAAASVGTTQLVSSPTITTPVLSGTTTAAAINASGNIDVTATGSGLKVAEGPNGKQGTFALSGAATTTVANTSVTANSRIFLQTQALGTVTVASTLAVSSRVAGTSFTVTPSQSTDTSTVAYEIFEVG